ncbi:hypothetical protein BU646_06550 [Staphylococcus chromogenes]|uniref:hypothetical protein n=2 Tax=Staphylococcus chromogenes TaxID=46126 RepID=UPI000D19E36D|nr:hypothetical protein [Staphylococcus chromogenes]MBV5191683.1 hypothetical protein [Staphylococcus chromogenes]MBW3132172.1 hypothetical protein [Staphylococcus chromogenes]PTF37989.1 hypothetical protein BUY17_08145 [Staphylococcus chromogenes]PTF48550.1 hypothetical protein BUY13_06635 [Staphylococcus chromogenes]PTF52728.1 hypothetical protein BUY12_00825 [Staphylococcus chromogenes]
MITYILAIIIILTIIILMLLANISYLKNIILVTFQSIKHWGLSVKKSISNNKSYNGKTILKCLKDKLGLKIFSFENTFNKFVFIVLLILLISLIMVKNDINYIYLMVFGVWLCTVRIFKEAKEIHDNLVIFLVSLILVCLFLGCLSSLIILGMNNNKFHMDHFLFWILTVIIGFIALYQSFRGLPKAISVVFLAYATAIPILFYIYLGFGLFYMNYQEELDQEDRYEITIHIKENEDSFNTAVALIYYGVSEVTSTDNIPVTIEETKNKPPNLKVREKSIMTMSLILIGHLYNIIYFSTIFALFTSLLQKKRYNSGK